jgi:hypothetical protein
MLTIPKMNKVQKNKARRKKNKATAMEAAKTDIEEIKIKDNNPFIKSVVVKNEVPDVNPQSTKEYIDTALAEAQKLWTELKKKGKDPKFVALPDKDKIEMFGVEFHAFNKEFPIVSRYLICMGQYSIKAFKRYLIKVQGFKHPEVRDKGYMEDQWVRRQADYVRYLWEAYQRGHINQSEAKAIWQDAYKTLKQEFIDFKSMHDDIEKDLEIEKEKNKGELIKELMSRLSSGDQSLDEKSMKELVEVMKIQLLQQRKEKVTNQILEIVPMIPASRESIGTYVEPIMPEPEDFPPGATSSQNIV